MDPRMTDILSKIFLHLCAEDRKKVRLTCRAWNRACKHPDITATEKFVIRMGNDGGSMKHLGDCIVKCAEIRTHVEFQSVPLLRLPAKVWEHCGGRIESLRLLDSGVDDRTVMNIIQYCKNLIDLRIRYAFADGMVKPDIREGDAFCSERLLKDMVKRKIVRKKLTTFKLYINRHVPNKMFEKIYKIYPCIKNLGQGFNDMLDCACELRLVHYHNPAGKWVLPTKIENFTSHTWDMSNHWTMPTQKLKGLSTMFNFEGATCRRDVEQFLSSQTELEKLHLVVAHGEPNYAEHESAKRLLFYILRNCHKLKKLYFHSFCADCDVDLSFSAQNLGDFLSLTSGMESVTLISGCGITLDDAFSIESESMPSTEYTRLKHLELRCGIDERIIIEILNRCHVPLNSLYLNPVNDKIMQKILKSQTELQTLHIKNVKCTKAGFLGVHAAASVPCKKSGLVGVRKTVVPKKTVKYSFARLQKLQHLAMENVPSGLLQDIALEFDLPALKCFEIGFKLENMMLYPQVHKLEEKMAALMVQMLLEIMSIQSPYLEILKIHEDLMTAKSLMKYCKKWKYLRFLGTSVVIQKDMFDGILPKELQPMIVRNKFDQEVEDMKKLFSQCPSLHWVANYTLACGYFYDRFSNKLVTFRENFTALNHKHNVFKKSRDE